MNENIETLGPIEVIGKGKNNEPFSVKMQKGLYFFVSIDQLNKLISTNNAYKEMDRTEIEPLKNVKIVGRGGIDGYRPFPLPGKDGRYLCVLVDHIKRLEQTRAAYEKLLAEKEKAKEAMETMEKKVEEVKKADSLKYVPDIVKNIEQSFTELKKLFINTEYRKCVELVPSTEELVAEVLKEIEEKKRAEELERRKIEERKKAEELDKKEIEERKEGETSGRYVYCIIPSTEKKSFGNIGIERSEVYTIPFKNMAIVLSNLPVKDYKDELEDNAVIHDQVVKKIMTECTVVPLAFGQVFKNEDILKTVLRKAKKDIRRAFKEIEGRVEFGIKVFLEKNQTLDEDAFAEDVKKLREVADSIKLGKRFDERMVLNAFYLVKNDRKGEFLQAVENLQKKYGQPNIQSTGPWPPYNFVEIKIGKGE